MNIYRKIGKQFGITETAAFTAFGKEVAAAIAAGKSPREIRRDLERQIRPTYWTEPCLRPR